MSHQDVRTTAYTLRADATARTVRAAYRGALLVQRHRLAGISVDVLSDEPWPPDTRAAVSRLQRRVHLPRRPLLPWSRPAPDITVDLDPRDDEDFVLAVAIGPYTVGGTGIADDNSIAWEVNGTGTSCCFHLTDDEHTALLDHLRAHDADLTALVPVHAAGQPSDAKAALRTLGLAGAVTTWQERYGRRQQHTREHTRPGHDVTIDGRPLRTWVGTDGEPDQGMPLLSFGGPQEAARAVTLLDVLLGDRPGFYGDGCEPILICPIDEDLLCGALAVRVLRHRDTATWRLGWHTTDHRGDVQRHTAPQPPAPQFFTFDLAQHDEVLGRARARFRTRAGNTPSPPWFPA